MLRKTVMSILTAVLLLVGTVLLVCAETDGAIPAGQAELDARRFQDILAQQSSQALKRQQNLAMWYNLNLVAEDPEPGYEEAYDQILCCMGEVMGCLEIPALDLLLPIYHEAESLPAEAVAHDADSAFPIGGIGNRSVLTGESEDGGAFSDLTELQAGDLFYIHILGRKLEYCVERIDVSLPEAAECMEMEPDLDLCTLVTSTPYGIHSHLLLVHGRRTDA